MSDGAPAHDGDAAQDVASTDTVDPDQRWWRATSPLDRHDWVILHMAHVSIVAAYS